MVGGVEGPSPIALHMKERHGLEDYDLGKPDSTLLAVHTTDHRSVYALMGALRRPHEHVGGEFLEGARLDEGHGC